MESLDPIIVANGENHPQNFFKIFFSFLSEKLFQILLSKNLQTPQK